MGPDFANRGYPYGKAEFAIDFDGVIQDQMANSIIEKFYRQFEDDGDERNSEKVDQLTQFYKGTIEKVKEHSEYGSNDLFDGMNRRILEALAARGKDKSAAQDAEDSQSTVHNLLMRHPRMSVTVAQYLNSEFQTMAYWNTRRIKAREQR